MKFVHFPYAEFYDLEMKVSSSNLLEYMQKDKPFPSYLI